MRSTLLLPFFLFAQSAQSAKNPTCNCCPSTGATASCTSYGWSKGEGWKRTLQSGQACMTSTEDTKHAITDDSNAAMPVPHCILKDNICPKTCKKIKDKVSPIGAVRKAVTGLFNK